MVHAIEIAGLTRRFGKTEAVQGLTLNVPAGAVYALLGPNGAGKTTTIKLVMNLLRPSAGSARVLGVDSRRLGPKELRRIGYVSESQKLPEWMTATELCAYCKPFYPTWDDQFAAQLIETFDLPPRARIARLSRGMRIKAALAVALAFRPQLLVLDEPFSGLDPVVRDDLTHAVRELTKESSWTVFLSSHEMDDVEKLATRIGFLDHGGLILDEPLDDLRARFTPSAQTAATPGEIAAPPSLREIFVTVARERRRGAERSVA
jgi:ABC-2 type transport system ATP-binding protein